MQITVKFANAAKDGKKFGSIVGKDDTRYPCPASMVGRFVKGQTYDVETATEKWGDSDVQVIKGVKANAAPASTGNGGNYGGDKWWMPFVSNTVAHAIQAGHITGPGEIGTWAKAAKLAAEAVAAPVKLPGGIEQMQDDLP